MKQKICTMNCGPALSDTRSQAERMAKCEDCAEVERGMEETMEDKHTRGPWEEEGVNSTTAVRDGRP